MSEVNPSSPRHKHNYTLFQIQGFKSRGVLEATGTLEKAQIKIFKRSPIKFAGFPH